MERALASAWEENSAIERKSKREGDRGRWKTGRQTGQKGRVMEQVAIFVSHRRVGQNEVTERRVKRGEGRETDETWMRKPNLCKL